MTIAPAQDWVTASTGASNANTLPVELGSAPVEGSLVLIAATSAQLVNTPAGYTVAKSVINLGALYLFYRVAGAAEPALVTLELASGSYPVAAAIGNYSGLVDADVLDVAPTGTSRTNNLTDALALPATGTLAQVNELVAGVVGGIESADTAAVTWAWDTYSEVADAATTNSGAVENVSLTVAVSIVSDTGSTTGAATPSTNSAGEALAASFLGSADEAPALARLWTRDRRRHRPALIGRVL